MEICAAAVTGMVFALFLGNLIVSRRARQRQEAGALLCAIPGRRTVLARVLLWAAAATVAAVCIQLLAYTLTRSVQDIVLVESSHNASINLTGGFRFANVEPIVALLGSFFVTFLVLLGLLWNRDCEVRESGMILPEAFARVFVRWPEITHCRWLDTQRLSVVLKDSPSCIVIPAGQNEPLSALLIERVEMRDADDGVMNPESPRPRKATIKEQASDQRAFQFSLRTLLLLVLLVSAGSGWLAVYLRHGGRERRALANLAPHATVSRDKGGRIKAITLDYGDIVYADHPTNSDLAYLSAFPYLEDLNIESDLVTDVGLKHLSSLDQLVNLELECDQVTDAGLARLESLKNLKTLTLGCPSVTTRGIARLRKALPNTDVRRSR